MTLNICPHMYTLQVCFALKGIEHVRSLLLKYASDSFEMGSFLLSPDSEDSTSTVEVQEAQANFEELITSTSEEMLSLMVQKVNSMVRLYLVHSISFSLSFTQSHPSKLHNRPVTAVCQKSLCFFYFQYHVPISKFYLNTHGMQKWV